MVHWPGDPAFHIERALDQDKGDPATISQMTLGVHTGTHMDAPVHFIRNGRTIDQIPLDATVGPARVILIRDQESIKREELLEHGISSGERILFKTANSDHVWDSDQFDEAFVFITQDGARYLSPNRGCARLASIIFPLAASIKTDPKHTMFFVGRVSGSSKG